MGGYRSSLSVRGGPPACPYCQAYKIDGESVELLPLEKRILLDVGPKIFRDFPIRLFWDLFLCNTCGRFILAQDPPEASPVKVPGGWISRGGEFEKERNFNISRRATPRISDPPEAR